MPLADTHIPNAASVDHTKNLSQPNLWRYDWTWRPDLQERFISADHYATHMADQERARTDAEAASQPESDRGNEAVLANHEREGRLRGDQGGTHRGSSISMFRVIAGRGPDSAA